MIWILLIFSLVKVPSLLAYDPVPAPSWANEAECVRELYVFPTKNPAPGPDQSHTPFLSSGAVVTLGPFAAGWRDPDPTLDPPQAAGHPDHGAWDLGKAGEIRITVPIGNAASVPGFAPYRVKIQVNVVGYTMFVALPSLSVPGYTLSELSQTDTNAFDDPVFGTWRNRTWTAVVEEVMDDEIMVVVTAHADVGSTVDAVEIYALDADAQSIFSTLRGTPVRWLQAHAITPAAGQDWDDADAVDSDSDGMLNWEEYVAGTNPTNAASVLKVVQVDAQVGDPLRLEWIGGTRGPVAPYVVESADCLMAPDWKPLGEHPRAEGLNVWTGPTVESSRKRFFRIRATRDAVPAP